MTEMARPLPVERIGPRGHEVTVTAEVAELAAIAARLRIPAVHALACRWRLRLAQSGSASGRVEAEGSLTARFERECVVSLDPFPVAIEHTFAVAFAPGELAIDAVDEPDAPDVLPYDGIAIDLGEATVEELALALDPFPRKPGATLPEQAAPEPGDRPFAALASRR